MTGRQLHQLVLLFGKLTPTGRRRMAATVPVPTQRLIARLWRIGEQAMRECGPPGTFSPSAYYDRLLDIDALARTPTLTIVAIARTGGPQ